MKKTEVYDLVRLVEENYKAFVKDEEELTNSWYKTLQHYTFEEIEYRLTSLMALEQFQYQPPTLPYLVKDIPTIEEKEQRKSYPISCNICKRRFQDAKEYEQHFSRCSSIRYLLRQAKKYLNRDLENDKNKFYWMSDEEFNNYYRKMILIVHDYTTNEYEKKCIEHILNPPSKEEAMQFLNEKI